MARGVKKMFSATEQEEIYYQYINGITQRELAEEYGCSRVTIGKICKGRGGSFHQRTLSMLMHDWNTGADIAKLVIKYRYSSTKYLNQRICKLRKDGMKFKDRRTKKLTAKELEAEMMARQIIIKECEQVFADGVREARG